MTKKKPAKKPTKKNPQDLTLRNLRALKKQIAKLEESIDYIKEQMLDLFRQRFNLEQQARDPKVFLNEDNKDFFTKEKADG